MFRFLLQKLDQLLGPPEYSLEDALAIHKRARGNYDRAVFITPADFVAAGFVLNAGGDPRRALKLYGNERVPHQKVERARYNAVLRSLERWAEEAERAESHSGEPGDSRMHAMFALTVSAIGLCVMIVLSAIDRYFNGRIGQNPGYS